MTTLKQWWPAIVAVLGAVLVVIQAAVDPLGVGREAVVLDEKIQILNAFLNAILVSIVPNLVAGISRVVKAVAFGLLSVSSVFASYWVGGLSVSDWINIVIMFGTGAGILAVNNRAPKHLMSPAVHRPAAG